MPPIAPKPTGPSPSSSLAWGRIVDEALAARSAERAGPPCLRTGELPPQLLCRYAAGQVSSTERRDVEAALARTPWAAGRVVRLVAGARPEAQSPLAAALLDAARAGAVDARRVVAGVLLHELGRADLALRVQRRDEGAPDAAPDPLQRAVALLGLGRNEAARRALVALAPAEGTLPALAREVAELEDDDDALVALLAAL